MIGDNERDRSRPPAGQARLWQIVREAAPPAGARQRVLAAIERQLGRQLGQRLEREPGLARRGGLSSLARRAVPAVACAAALVAALAVWRLRAGEPGEPRPVVLSATGARHHGGGSAIAPGDAVGVGAVDVAAAGHLSMQLSQSRVDVAGPGTVEVLDRGLHLHAGAMVVNGQLAVEGPSCTARIDGRSEVAVRGARLEVRVFAGSAEITAPEQTCEVIDLTAPAAPDPAGDAGAGKAPRGEAVLGGTSPGGAATDAADGDADTDAGVADGDSDDAAAREPAPAEPDVDAAGGDADDHRPDDHYPDDSIAAVPSSPGRAAPAAAPRRPARRGPRRSALSEQVEAYWAAVALRTSAPAEALRRLRAIARRWPRGTIRPEVELAIYDTLRELGRADEACAQARRILDRDPRTPRARELDDYVREADNN